MHFVFGLFVVSFEVVAGIELQGKSIAVFHEESEALLRFLELAHVDVCKLVLQSGYVFL